MREVFAFLISFVILNACCAAEISKPIVDVRFDATYRQIDPSFGDEWAPTWGRGDVLYTGVNDGNAFGGVSAGPFVFGQLKGDDPYQLKGTTLNGMQDFREPKELEPQFARWRTLDSYATDGALYRFVPCKSDVAKGSCIEDSADGGKTWRAATEARRPFFRGENLGIASFVAYRRDIERLIGHAGQYVYASAYAGVVDGSDGYILGRVPRDKFRQRNPDDWLFQQGDQSWKSSVEEASIQYNGMNVGPDGANWKVTNAYSVSGVLYAFVTRCFYPWLSDDPKHRHVFKNSSVIKSPDSGRTWQRVASENYSNPMFPGTRFGAPYFVWYGKDGEASVDNADRYVYAVSNDGHFEGGDNYILGRVPKARLPALSATDWSFYRAGDGMRNDSWSSSRDRALPILVNPERAGMTGMTYVEGLHRYVMVAWHYTHGRIGFGTALMDGDLSTALEFFEAPKPWGPWTLVKSFDTGKFSWYAPILGQRFQTKTDSATVTGFLYVSGLTSKPEGGLDFSLYKLNYLPVTLSTKSLPHAALAAFSGR